MASPLALVSQLRRTSSTKLKDPAVRAKVATAAFSVPKFTRAANPDTAVLIAPPGDGNIGDQALVEAFLEMVPGKVALVTRRATSFTIPLEDAGRVRLVVLPSLVYGGMRGFAADIVRFRALLKTATSVSVSGADVMDGAYNYRASANRSNIAELAQSHGIPARVLGFSWNGRAEATALAALRAAAAGGVQLFLRDPLSFERAAADRLPNIQPTADTVFAAQRVSTDRAEKILEPLVGTYEKIALVNVSGLIANSADQKQGYLDVIAHLRAQGQAVVLLPHVSRTGADDAIACRDVYNAVGTTDDGVVLVEGLLTPPQIRGLTAKASVVVTGRMHLAVMSMMNGVAPVTLATQGKVEGLMQLFDTDFLCVEPGDGFPERVIAALDTLAEQGNAVRERLLARLPEIRTMAEANFVGLRNS